MLLNKGLNLLNRTRFDASDWTTNVIQPEYAVSSYVTKTLDDLVSEFALLLYSQCLSYRIIYEDGFEIENMMLSDIIVRYIDK